MTSEHDNKTEPDNDTKISWKNLLRQIKTRISEDHLSMIAAGVAYYIMLSSIPMIAAAISLYGFFADPHDIQNHFAEAETIVPEAAHQLLFEQMDRLAGEQGGAGFGALIGILLALWAGSRAVKVLMRALDIIYRNKEKRGFIKFSAVGFLPTLMLVITGVIAVALITFLPPLLGLLPLPGILQTSIRILIWPVLLLIGMVAISLLYRFGPSRPHPAWKWLTRGSITATLLWLIASAGLTIYISNFGNYNKTYGTLGGIVILLLWFWLTAFVFLLGAELDAAIEQQKNELEL